MKIKHIIFFLLFCSLSCSCSRNYPSKYEEVFNGIGEELGIFRKLVFDTRYYSLGTTVLDCEKSERSSKHFDVYNVIYELSVELKSAKEIEPVLDSIRNCQLEDLGILENTIEDLKDSIALEKEACNYNRFLSLRKVLIGKRITFALKSHRRDDNGFDKEDTEYKVVENFLKHNWSLYSEGRYEADFKEFGRIMSPHWEFLDQRFEVIDGKRWLIREYSGEYSIENFQKDSASLSYEVGDRWHSNDRYPFKYQWGDRLFDLVNTLDKRIKEKNDLNDKVKVPYENIIESYKQQMETFKIAGVDRLYMPVVVSINKKTESAEYQYPKDGPFSHMHAQEWLENQ